MKKAIDVMKSGVDEVRWKEWHPDEIEMVFYKKGEGQGSVWVTRAGVASMMQHMVGVFFVETT